MRMRFYMRFCNILNRLHIPHCIIIFFVLIINVTSENTCPGKFGYFPDPSSCQGYFICTFGNAKARKCGNGLHYKTTTQTCDKPTGDCAQDGDQATRSKYTGPAMKTGNAPPPPSAPATSAPTEPGPSENQQPSPAPLATQASVEQPYPPNQNNPDDQQQAPSAGNYPPPQGSIKQVSKNADFSALTNRNAGRDTVPAPSTVTETARDAVPKKPNFSQYNVKPSFNQAPPKAAFQDPSPAAKSSPPAKPSAGKSSYSDAVRAAFNNKPSFGNKKKPLVHPIPPPPTVPPVPVESNPPDQQNPDVNEGQRTDARPHSNFDNENGNDQNAEAGQRDNSPPPRPRPPIPKNLQKPAPVNRNPDVDNWDRDGAQPQQPSTGDRWSPVQTDQSARGQSDRVDGHQEQEGSRGQQDQDGHRRVKQRPFAATQTDQQPVDNFVKQPVNSRKPSLRPTQSRGRNRGPAEIMLPADSVASQCSADVCPLPNCMCGSTNIPNQMQIADVPQMVLLSFDAEINERNLPIYEQIFHKSRKNPSGCNIKATFFVSHEFTNYGMVRYLYEKGHEIGSNSITHGVGTGFKGEKAWETEMTGEKGFLASFASIRPDDIKGARAPLLGGGGDDQFQALTNGQFTYDSTLVTPTSSKAPYWPYTLDYGVPHACVQPPCPQRSYAGVWELPLNPIYGLFGENCYEADRCTFGSTGNEVYKLLYSNFYDRHYSINKAPFHLAIHADWLKYPPHREAFERFLDLVATMPDVWVVTGSQAVAWMQNPTPLSQLASFAPWQCSADDASRLPTCDTINACPLPFRDRLRYFYTCSECPAEFPWRPETK